jgi:hypothetical protein
VGPADATSRGRCLIRPSVCVVALLCPGWLSASGAQTRKRKASSPSFLLLVREEVVNTEMRTQQKSEKDKAHATTTAPTSNTSTRSEVVNAASNATIQRPQHRAVVLVLLQAQFLHDGQGLRNGLSRCREQSRLHHAAPSTPLRAPLNALSVRQRGPVVVQEAVASA